MGSMGSLTGKVRLQDEQERRQDEQDRLQDGLLNDHVMLQDDQYML